MEFINLKQAAGGHIVVVLVVLIVGDVKYIVSVVELEDDIVVADVVSNGFKELHKILEVKTFVVIADDEDNDNNDDVAVVSRGQKVFKLFFMLLHKVLV